MTNYKKEGFTDEEVRALDEENKAKGYGRVAYTENAEGKIIHLQYRKYIDLTEFGKKPHKGGAKMWGLGFKTDETSEEGDVDLAKKSCYGHMDRLETQDCSECSPTIENKCWHLSFKPVEEEKKGR